MSAQIRSRDMPTVKAEMTRSSVVFSCLVAINIFTVEMVTTSSGHSIQASFKTLQQERTRKETTSMVETAMISCTEIKAKISSTETSILIAMTKQMVEMISSTLVIRKKKTMAHGPLV